MKERKVVVASLTGAGLLLGYVLTGLWPHLASSYPALVTRLVTLAGGFFVGNVAAKAVTPPLK